MEERQNNEPLVHRVFSGRRNNKKNAAVVCVVLWVVRMNLNIYIYILCTDDICSSVVSFGRDLPVPLAVVASW